MKKYILKSLQADADKLDADYIKSHVVTARQVKKATEVKAAYGPDTAATGSYIVTKDDGSIVVLRAKDFNQQYTDWTK